MNHFRLHRPLRAPLAAVLLAAPAVSLPPFAAHAATCNPADDPSVGAHGHLAAVAAASSACKEQRDALQGQYEGDLHLKFESSGQVQGAPFQMTFVLQIDAPLYLSINSSAQVMGTSGGHIMSTFEGRGIGVGAPVTNQGGTSIEDINLEMVGVAKKGSGFFAEVRSVTTGTTTGSACVDGGGCTGGSGTATESVPVGSSMHLNVDELDCDHMGGQVNAASLLQNLQARDAQMGLRTAIHVARWDVQFQQRDPAKKQQADQAIADYQTEAAAGAGNLLGWPQADFLRAISSLGVKALQMSDGGDAYAQCQADRIKRFGNHQLLQRMDAVTAAIPAGVLSYAEVRATMSSYIGIMKASMLLFDECDEVAAEGYERMRKLTSDAVDRLVASGTSDIREVLKIGRMAAIVGNNAAVETALNYAGDLAETALADALQDPNATPAQLRQAARDAEQLGRPATGAQAEALEARLTTTPDA